MKILTVEDDPVAHAVLSDSLTAFGHEVVSASNGEEGWQLLRRDAIRLVVCDWAMPVVDGLELCRRVRKLKTDYVYFILLTAVSASDQNRDVALAAGIDDFMPKPIDFQDMKMRLHVASRIIEYTSHIRQLESFIPICSYCKNIRDDQSYWHKIERYISERTGSAFSHSVCPVCYDKHIVPQLKELGVIAPERPVTPPTARRVNDRDEAFLT